MTMSTCSQSRTPSIAAEPVSPLVAPTIVIRSLRWPSTWSNSRPTSCRARSLNASVGPWNSSSNHSSGPIWTSGATAGWSNVAYASAHICSSATRVTPPGPVAYGAMTAAAMVA